MTQELLALRQDVYSNAAQFHGAMAKYYAALNESAPKEDVTNLRRAAREAGVIYNSALVALFKHLQSQPNNAGMRREAEQTERTISLLSFGVQQL